MCPDVQITGLMEGAPIETFFDGLDVPLAHHVLPHSSYGVLVCPYSHIKILTEVFLSLVIQNFESNHAFTRELMLEWSQFAGIDTLARFASWSGAIHITGVGAGRGNHAPFAPHVAHQKDRGVIVGPCFHVDLLRGIQLSLGIEHSETNQVLRFQVLLGKCIGLCARFASRI